MSKHLPLILILLGGFFTTHAQDDPCGFLQTYDQPLPFTPFSIVNATLTATETPTGFQVTATNRNAATEMIDRLQFDTDAAGVVTASSIGSDTIPAQPNTTVTEYMGGITIAYEDADGTLLFTTDVDINPPGGAPVLDQITNELQPANGGFLLVGTTVTDGPTGVNFTQFVIRLDADGNFIGLDFLPDMDVISSAARIVPQADGNGDYVVTFRAGNVDLHLVDGAGMLVWKADLFSDTPSSELYELEEAPDGSGIFVSTRDNNSGVIRKFDAATGDAVLTVDLGAPLSTGGAILLFENVEEFIVTPDGGLVYAGFGNYSPDAGGGFDFTGFYARVDAMGNPVWSGLLPDLTGLDDLDFLRAQTQTADGGFLFVGGSGGDFETASNALLLKMTPDGTLTPTCTVGGGGTDGVDVELTIDQPDTDPVQFGFYNVSVTVSNAGSANATGVRVAVPAPSGVVYEGGNEFTASAGSFDPFGGGIWNVGNLAAGQSETLTVNYFLLAASASVSYAQVTGQNELDVDSTPNNGTPPEPVEDDEANTDIGSGTVSVPPADVDLEIFSFSASATPDQYEFYTVIATIRNAGEDVATGVVVSLPLPGGVVYEGGNEFGASQGSFDAFGGGVWDVGNINPGATATLAVNYFLLASEAPVSYVQVIAQNEPESDSAPNNGTPPTPNEDDEASLFDDGLLGSGGSAARRMLPGTAAGKLLRVFPNPVVEGFTVVELEVGPSGSQTLDVYDARGALMQSFQADLEAGVQQWTLELDHLAAGMYQVRLRGSAQTLRLMVQ